VKVACVATGWYPQSPGGLEKYVYGLTHALLRAGDGVDLFITGEPVNAATCGARIVSLARDGDPLWKRALDARRAFSTSFREPYDVINLHFALTALPLIPFISHRTPRVIHFHGPWAAESRAEDGNAISVMVKKAIETFVYARADRFIVLSNAFKEVLVGYGVPADAVQIIPMGIDSDLFRPPDDRASVRAELGWPSDHTVFFTARRLINRVGLPELLNATRIVRNKYSQFVVKIAGKGPQRAELERTIDELGLSDTVELLGFVPEERLVRAYQAADVTVLPTQTLEGFGTVIAESLACGTPVIVTPVGGMPEAVAPLDERLVARSRSPHDIAERMSAVLDGTLPLTDREACRRYAERYRWDLVAENVRDVFMQR
jgi:glycosyltransferase involved in cell wall biosynthesis